MPLVAVRPIDLAIFASLGGLWIMGALFVYWVWRWVIRYERSTRRPEPLLHPPRQQTSIRPARQSSTTAGGKTPAPSLG
jgi:hypothetical protein